MKQVSESLPVLFSQKGDFPVNRCLFLHDQFANRHVSGQLIGEESVEFR